MHLKIGVEHSPFSPFLLYASKTSIHVATHCMSLTAARHPKIWLALSQAVYGRISDNTIHRKNNTSTNISLS